jgi:hypothetical protein
MRVAALALLALVLAGCGAPAADLFVVKRAGADRNANLTLLVSDDGSVTCNGRRHEIPGDMLLDARELTRNLGPQAELNLALPRGPKAVLTYHVRMQAGTLAFSDTSRPMPSSFAQLTVFTKHVSEDVCGLKRG